MIGRRTENILFIYWIFFAFYLLSTYWLLAATGQMDYMALQRATETVFQGHIPAEVRIFPDFILYAAVHLVFSEWYALFFYSIGLQGLLFGSLWFLAKSAGHSMPLLFSLIVLSLLNILSLSEHESLYIFADYVRKHAGSLINLLFLIGFILHFMRSRRVTRSYIYLAGGLIFLACFSQRIFFLSALIPGIALIIRSRVRFKNDNFIQPIVYFILLATLASKLGASFYHIPLAESGGIHSSMVYFYEFSDLILNHATILLCMLMVFVVSFFLIYSRQRIKFEYVILFRLFAMQIIFTLVITFLFGYHQGKFLLADFLLPLIGIPVVLGFFLIEFRFKPLISLKNYCYGMILMIFLFTNWDASMEKKEELAGESKSFHVLLFLQKGLRSQDSIVTDIHVE